MRLLIATQAVDRTDPILGFFHRWIEEFAKHSEKVTVICLRKGDYDLPANVEVISLGKMTHHRLTVLSRFAYAARFLRLIVNKRNEYDAVFVHMNPEYIVLGGVLWRAMGKRVGLWYTHKKVNCRLRIATVLSHVVFTASPESFRLKSKKVAVMGHGVDVSDYAYASRAQIGEELRIITIGRISETKRIREMIMTCDELSARGIPFSLSIIGMAATEEDEAYARALDGDVQTRAYRDRVEIRSASHTEVPNLLKDADVFLNLSTTGSMDKAVLEALASGVPVVTSNEAFKDALSPYGLFVSPLTPSAVADVLVHASEKNIAPLRAWVEKEHSLSSLASRIISRLENSKGI
ncbi:MAG TPA: glycosyltransferase family 4 protein [Candidatus Paceibacterota bacterium]